MKRTPVESSNIVSIGYYRRPRILEIEFIGGKVWHYADVPPETINELMEASSKGKYFSAYIKPKYAGCQQEMDPNVDKLVKGAVFWTGIVHDDEPPFYLKWEVQYVEETDHPIFEKGTDHVRFGATTCDGETYRWYTSDIFRHGHAAWDKALVVREALRITKERVNDLTKLLELYEYNLSMLEQEAEKLHA